MMITFSVFRQIVDIGSGRGYLGCQMALMHGLRVLGIDSSETNTQSADKRAGKLGKQWQGLLRNANEGKLGKVPRLKKVKGSKERSMVDVVRCNDDDMPDLSLVFNDDDSCGVELEASKDSVLMGDDKKGEITVTDNVCPNCLETTNSLSCNGHCTVSTGVNKQFGSHENDKARCDKKSQSNEPLDDQSASKKHEEHGQKPEGKYHKVSKKNNAQKCTKTSYVAITCYVTPDLNLTELFDTFSPWSSFDSDRASSDHTGRDHHKGVLMSGLHTCGNLAASMLLLFSTSGATVVMCNVGCCYHLLEEQFLRSPFSKQEQGWCNNSLNILLCHLHTCPLNLSSVSLFFQFIHIWYLFIPIKISIQSFGCQFYTLPTCKLCLI